MLESLRILSRKCFTNVGEGQGREGEIGRILARVGATFMSHVHILLIFIYFILAALGLCCCTGAFFS